MTVATTASAEETVTAGAGARPLWRLEPGMRYLNHGAFGATPVAVQEAQDRWRARMEAHPARFFGQELPGALRTAATALAGFVGTAPERLAFVENATSGMNAVLRSLDLGPDDEILCTDHVYRAVRHTLDFVAGRSGVRIVQVSAGMPVAGPAAVVDAVAAALGPRTRLVAIDHVASASAVIMPVAEIAALCRARGVPVLVDGAHAPGLLDLDVDALGVDWYTGNCHKWLCAPKGAGFLAVAPGEGGGARPPLRPLVVSHNFGQGFPLEFDKVGTRDATAWLAVPDAIAFHERLGGAALRRRNAALARTVGGRLAAALGTGLGAPEEMFAAMVTVRLPETGVAPSWETAAPIRERLWALGRVEAPVMPLGGAFWLRLSVQAYNDAADYDGLDDLVRRAIDR